MVSNESTEHGGVRTQIIRTLRLRLAMPWARPGATYGTRALLWSRSASPVEVYGARFLVRMVSTQTACMRVPRMCPANAPACALHLCLTVPRDGDGATCGTSGALLSDSAPPPTAHDARFLVRMTLSSVCLVQG